MHSIEQQKQHPDSKTLPKMIKYMKKWLKKLHGDNLKTMVDNVPTIQAEVVQSPTDAG